RDAGTRSRDQAAAPSAAATAGAAAALADRQGPLYRAAAATASGCGVVGEGERHVDLGVPGEALGVLQVERAPRAIDAVVAGAERAGRAGHVAQEEAGAVDEQVGVALAGDRDPPQDRLCKRVLDRLAFERIRAARSERLIGLHEHHAGADALEVDQPSGAAGSAIEADVVRAKAGRQP